MCSMIKMEGLGRIPDFDSLDSFVPCQVECDECAHFGEEHDDVQSHKSWKHEFQSILPQILSLTLILYGIRKFQGSLKYKGEKVLH